MLLSSLRDGDALIIVPPMADLHVPSMAAHVLQAWAREAGLQVSVLYANLSLALVIGAENYKAICSAPQTALVGERFFAASAYGLLPLGRDPENMLDPCARIGISRETADPRMVQAIDFFARFTPSRGPELSELKRLETLAGGWADRVSKAVTDKSFKVVGCTNHFEQTASSVALLNRIKRLRPDIVTIMGGANCEGEMGQGIATLSPAIDYVFSGEGDVVFPDFLRRALQGELPQERIIYGRPCMNLDVVPLTDFSEFYEQLEGFTPSLAAKPEDIVLPYETSRGCWWGEKQRCKFCGFNRAGLEFRQKSPERVIADLQQLLTRYTFDHIWLTDNIMSQNYFKTLFPRLGDSVPGLKIHCEQKANLSLDQVVLLKRAGIEHFQAGIESLSTPILKLMNKGVSARQNIALLRYVRSVGIKMSWNIIWAFPGDQPSDYQDMLSLMPLLHHLYPPTMMQHLSIDRFSVYFEQREKHGLCNLRPWGSYAMVLPDGVDPAQIASHFTADYPSGAHQNPKIVFDLYRQVAAWQACWYAQGSSPPELSVTRQSDDRFLLRDTRGLPGTQASYTLKRQQAAVALTARRPDQTPEMSWALGHKVGILLDGWYVPLATAEPELLRAFKDGRNV